MNKDGALSAWEFLTRARPNDYQGHSYTKYIHIPTMRPTLPHHIMSYPCVVIIVGLQRIIQTNLKKKESESSYEHH
jgi:hypothetical protein